MTTLFKVRDYNAANGGNGVPEAYGSDGDNPAVALINLDQIACAHPTTHFGQDYMHVQMAGRAHLIIRMHEWDRIMSKVDYAEAV